METMPKIVIVMTIGNDKSVADDEDNKEDNTTQWPTIDTIQWY